MENGHGEDKDNRHVVGIGEILWDRMFRGGKPVRRGRKLGGAPANFAYHASQFGHNGLVVSAIGYDRDGKDRVTRNPTLESQCKSKSKIPWACNQLT